MSDWTEEERRVTCAGCEAIVSPHTSRPYCASCLEARGLAHVEAAKHIMRLMAERDRALALLEQAWWKGRLSATAQGLEPPNATGPKLRVRCKHDIDALLEEDR